MRISLTVGVVVALAISTVAAAQVGSDVRGDQGRGRAREACKADLAQFCPDAQPGGGRLMACMRAHKDELSDGCKAALAAARAARGDGRDQGAPSVSAPN